MLIPICTVWHCDHQFIAWTITRRNDNDELCTVCWSRDDELLPGGNAIGHDDLDLFHARLCNLMIFQNHFFLVHGRGNERV